MKSVKLNYLYDFSEVKAFSRAHVDDGICGPRTGKFRKLIRDELCLIALPLSTPDQPYCITKKQLGVANYHEAWIPRNNFLIISTYNIRQIMANFSIVIEKICIVSHKDKKR